MLNVTNNHLKERCKHGEEIIGFEKCARASVSPTRELKINFLDLQLTFLFSPVLPVKLADFSSSQSWVTFPVLPFKNGTE